MVFHLFISAFILNGIPIVVATELDITDTKVTSEREQKEVEKTHSFVGGLSEETKDSISTSTEKITDEEMNITSNDFTIDENNLLEETMDSSLFSNSIYSGISLHGINDGAILLGRSGSRLQMSVPGPVYVAFHRYFPDLYVKIDIIRSPLQNSEPFFTFVAPGINSSVTIRNNFNQQVPNIQTGDIIRIYHVEANSRLRWNDGTTRIPSVNLTAYFGVTDTGFTLLRTERATVIPGTITTEVTDSQLAAQAANYLNLGNNPGVEISGFIQYPDRSKIGSTTGIIRVQQEITSGQYAYYDYTVPFTVTDAFEFDIHSQYLTLSQTGNAIDLSKIVSDVTYGDQQLTESDYEITISEMVNTNTVGEKKGSFTIRHNEKGFSRTFEVPIHVLWGNSIFLGGNAFGSIGTYTYFPENNKISVTWGTSVNGASQIHPPTGENLYYSVSLFNPTQDNQVISEIDPYFNFTGLGNQNPNIFHTIPNNQTIDVLEGDIMEIYHRESLIAPRTLRLYENEQERNLAKIKETTYVELTNDGYRELYFNRIPIAKRVIVAARTNQDLDLSINDYIDLNQTPNVEIVGFISYPDRSQLGITTGTIRVQEKLSTGRYIQKDYEIPFEVTSSFEFEVHSQNIYLSQNEDALDLTKIVSDVKYDGKILSESEYVIEVETMVETETVGLKNGRFTITNKETGEQLAFEAPIQVLWGNSISLSGHGFRSIGNYTYFPESDKIAVNWGEAINDGSIPIHPGTDNDIYYSVSLFTPTEDYQVLTELNPYFTLSGKGNQNPNIIDAIPNNRTIGVSEGDIMEIYHLQSLTHPTLLQIHKNEDRRNLARITETSYVELTKDGYRELTFAKIRIKKNDIRINTSKEFLDNNIKEYLILDDAENVEPVKFVSYPDTSNVGESSGIIRVQERLASGKYIQKDYEVPFVIAYTNLTLETVPENLNFGINNHVSTVRQWLPIENLNDNNLVAIFDGRQDRTDWSLSAKASNLKSLNDGSYIYFARYRFSLDTGENKVIQADGQTSTTFSLDTGDGSDRNYKTFFKSIDLFLPELSGSSDAKYEGEITWTIDIVP
ncbi:hypothetical protein D920_00076 [Enterococcus faecalis 13-SD-W-01]|nr:hypothetical protein D920_00076 [Enterococcus faecalis 13-SD-W-01]